MKGKKLNRIKWLFTILIIVMLLNVVLLLLPAILGAKNVPELDEKDTFVEENLGGSIDESTLVDKGMSSGEDIEDMSGGSNSVGSVENMSGSSNSADSVEDMSDSSNSADSVEDMSGSDNSADSVEDSISENENLTGSVESNALGKDDGFTDDFSNEQDMPENNPTPTIIPDENFDDNTVTLCLMGDLMCLAGQQYTAERRDGSHDYTGSFYLLRDTFSSCDFVIGNLETTLSESNPYSTKEREVNEQPNCNAPADYLDSLKWAGITHLVTANNHSLDGGLIGIEETIAHLEEYGIPHTGTYREDYSGARYLMLEKNGIRIALICFTELINQRGLVTASQLSGIIDSYSRADAEKRIAQARADGADFVVVYEHWGSENVHEVRAYQKSHAKEIAEAGADLIIGSHPHCLQEMEMIATQDGRSVPCFYSLGNVVSSMTRDINHDTVFVLVQLQRNMGEDSTNMGEDSTNMGEEGAEQPPQPDNAEILGTERVSITSLSLLACHVLTSFDGNYRVITPVNHPTDEEKAAAELAEAKTRIEEIFPSFY